MNIICYLLPSVVATGVLKKLSGDRSKSFYFCNLSFFVLAVTLLNYSIIYLFFGNNYPAIDFNVADMLFVIRYLLISMVWSIILPLMVLFVDSKFDFSVHFEHSGNNNE